MSTIFGFVCLAGAIALFFTFLPKAVRESGVQRTVPLKRPPNPDPVKCNH